MKKLLCVMSALFFAMPLALSVNQPDTRAEIVLPVIMYHYVLEDPSETSDFVITPDKFRSDMEELKANGYQTITIRELVEWVRDDGAAVEPNKDGIVLKRGEALSLPEKPVLVTFDDGHYGMWKYLKDYIVENDIDVVMNIQGVFTQKAQEEGTHEHKYSYLNYDDIREMVESGCVEIGNHTFDMHNKNSRQGSLRNPGESVESYRSALTEDTGKLNSLLQLNCGVTPTAFAYPFGYVSEESKPILGDAGFTVLMTCYEVPNVIKKGDAMPLTLRRFNRDGRVSAEQFVGRMLRSADGGINN